MNIRFVYSHHAETFLTRNANSITFERVEAGLTLAANKILLAEQNTSNIRKMEGEWRGYHRLRLGRFRVIFRLAEGDPVILFIEEAERRGNIDY